MVIEMERVKWSRRKIKHQLDVVDIKKNSSNEVGHVISKIKALELELTIFWVFVFLVVLSVSGYLLFSTVQRIEKHHTLKSGTLVTDYDEIATGMGDVVTLISDPASIQQENYSFTVRNLGDKSVQYTVFLEDDLDMVKMDECSDSLLDRSFIYYQMSDDVKQDLSSVFDGEHYVLAQGVLGAKSKRKYYLSLSIARDKVLTNQHYHGKIVVQMQN